MCQEATVKMKFMKLGSRPDTFYTEEATRTVMSDVQSDLTIKINSITYLLHKYPLLPKSGLLQRLYTESEDSTIELHEIPGGEEAFELCAKFCYGITINLSAQNFVSSFCAAKFLRMTEAVDSGNLVMKLEVFFSSCILEGWKDPIVALQNADKVFEWAENLGIVRRCIESIVDKILTPPSKVSWSYTYTRPGYEKKRHQSVPKDWWTEDVSFLNVDMFRCIISAIRSTNSLPPQLIGEALHVYACRWLPEITGKWSPEAETASNQNDKRRLLETVVGLIPSYRGSVSFRFLLRLMSVANVLEASPAAKAELQRTAGAQLEEATLNDLLVLPAKSGDDRSSYDVELIQAVLESFLRQWKRQVPSDERESNRSMRKIGKLIDSYLQIVAKGAKIPVEKMAALAETLPGIARSDHDDLYKAINVYLKEHPDLSKTEKKQLCRVLDCQKLSPETSAHAVRNERLPLRTVVQVLFFEQEKSNSSTNRREISPEQSSDERERERGSTSGGVHENSSKSQDKLRLKSEPSFKVREEIAESRAQLNSSEKALIRRISQKSHT